MKTDNFPYGELTYEVIGVLYKVHNKLGPLYQEKYYQRAIEIELQNRKIPFQREHPVPLYFEMKSIGIYKDICI